MRKMLIKFVGKWFTCKCALLRHKIVRARHVHGNCTILCAVLVPHRCNTCATPVKKLCGICATRVQYLCRKVWHTCEKLEHSSDCRDSSSCAPGKVSSRLRWTCAHVDLAIRIKRWLKEVSKSCWCGQKCGALSKTKIYLKPTQKIKWADMRGCEQGWQGMTRLVRVQARVEASHSGGRPEW